MARRPSADRPTERGGLWIGLCQTVMYPAAWLLGRERVIGGEHLRRPDGYLVVANHISHLDPLYDAVILKKHGRIPRFMAKASLWKVPVLGRALRGTAQIPVERGPRGAGQASLTAATSALDAGQVVVIYPDGTVTKDPERWPMRPRPGVASLALAGDFPVIPVAQWGTHAVYDSYAQGRKFRPWPRKDIVVKVGPPIDLSALRARGVDARTTLEATLLIMGTVRDLLADIRGEAAPTAWYDPKKAAARPVAGDGSGSPTSAPKAAGQVHTEPIEPAPTQPGPVQQGPTQAGPVPSGPIQQGPTQAGPVQAGPTQAGPVPSGPIQQGPTQAGPVQAGPTQAGPTQQDPIQPAPIQPGPTQPGPTP